MAYVIYGLLISCAALGLRSVSINNEVIRTLAEITLVIVLFTDASRIQLKLLRREYSLPLRLLGLGLPITIVLGTVLATILFPSLNIWEAAVLSTILAPTDAASQSTWQMWLYAIGSLTVARIVGVAIATIGSGLHPISVLFIGWFGPRGIASIIYGLVIVEEEKLVSSDLIFATMVITVLINIFAHGLTAVPGANWYGDWLGNLPSEDRMKGKQANQKQMPEHKPVPEMAVRYLYCGNYPHWSDRFESAVFRSPLANGCNCWLWRWVFMDYFNHHNAKSAQNKITKQE